MRANLIVIGLVLLLFAYVISLISVPWIEWVGDIFPTPQYAPISLRPVAYVFGCIGIIIIVFGLTKNPIAQVFFSFLSVMLCLALLTGFLSLEAIGEWGKKLISFKDAFILWGVWI